jgi:hypothetical protein
MKDQKEMLKDITELHLSASFDEYKSRNHWVTYKLCRACNIIKSTAEWTARDQRSRTQRAREGAVGAGGLCPSGCLLE